MSIHCVNNGSVSGFMEIRSLALWLLEDHIMYCLCNASEGLINDMSIFVGQVVKQQGELQV